MAYDIGDLVRCRGTFKDPDALDALVDPSTVTFKIKNPAGVTTTYVYGTDVQLVKESIGKYRVDVSATSVGPWYYRFESTGTFQAAQEDSFRVVQGAF